MTDPQQRQRNRTLLGGFVLLASLLFLFTLFQAGTLQDWLNPGKRLQLVLPDEGLYGLAEGAKVEVLGTPAGKILRIVIEPDQKIHAEARIEDSMAAFIRRDSKAVIRKTFGVAGDGYLEITRGHGEQMDWEYAALNAQPDRAPTESIGEMMEDVRSRVIPILDQTERAITAVADLTESLANPEGSLQHMLADISSLTGRIERGEGSLGRLVSEDKAAREFERLLANANEAMSRLAPLLGELQLTVKEITAMSRSLNAQSDDLPKISAHVVSLLASLDDVVKDLRATTPELPKITRDISASTASLPTLLGMTQQTLAELEGLLRQMRGSWLLGGGGPAEGGSRRLPASEVRP